MRKNLNDAAVLKLLKRCWDNEQPALLYGYTVTPAKSVIQLTMGCCGWQFEVKGDVSWDTSYYFYTWESFKKHYKEYFTNKYFHTFWDPQELGETTKKRKKK